MADSTVNILVRHILLAEMTGTLQALRRLLDSHASFDACVSLRVQLEELFHPYPARQNCSKLGWRWDPANTRFFNDLTGQTHRFRWEDWVGLAIYSIPEHSCAINPASEIYLVRSTAAQFLSQAGGWVQPFLGNSYWARPSSQPPVLEDPILVKAAGLLKEDLSNGRSKVSVL